MDSEASSYAAYCRGQQIDSSRTKYTWFISSSPSSDRVFNYQPVQQATVFTAFDGKVLEPVYLNRSTYIRCSVQAITRLGTPGGTRLSEGVYLSRSVLSLTEDDNCDSVSSFFELHENDGFTGHPEVSVYHHEGKDLCVMHIASLTSHIHRVHMGVYVLLLCLCSGHTFF